MTSIAKPAVERREVVLQRYTELCEEFEIAERGEYTPLLTALHDAYNAGAAEHAASSRAGQEGICPNCGYAPVIAIPPPPPESK